MAADAGTATDIGIGADGSVYAIGTERILPYRRKQYSEMERHSWDTMPDCAGIHIAVDPHGTPWVVNKSNIVFQYGGNDLWNPITGVAGNDIGIGADGSVYVTGKDSPLLLISPPVYKFNSWFDMDAGTRISGISISVGPTGRPW